MTKTLSTVRAKPGSVCHLMAALLSVDVIRRYIGRRYGVDHSASRGRAASLGSALRPGGNGCGESLVSVLGDSGDHPDFTQELPRKLLPTRAVRSHKFNGRSAGVSTGV